MGEAGGSDPCRGARLEAGDPVELAAHVVVSKRGSPGFCRELVVECPRSLETLIVKPLNAALHLLWKFSHLRELVNKFKCSLLAMCELDHLKECPNCELGLVGGGLGF